MKIRLLFSAFLLLGAQEINASLKNEDGRFALYGGVGNASIAWLGPISVANFKLGAAAEYWFNKNFSLGIDMGMGSEGYGKVIGTTSQSMVNLETGAFILDPGIRTTGALDPMGHFTLYANFRLGFPLRSAYSGAFSLGPGVGTLIAINEWVALDLAANLNMVANFKFTYLATIFTVGSVGFRVFI